MEPRYNATISDIIDDQSEVISLIPIYDESTNITSAIVVFYIHSEGGAYMILDRATFENISDSNIQLDPNDPTDIATKEELMTMFFNFDCYLTCQSNAVTTRGPECPKFSLSGWEKFKRWFNRTFIRGGYPSGGVIIIGGGEWDLGIPGEYLNGTWGIPPLEYCSPSNNGPFNPPFLDALLILQMDCDPDDGEYVDVGIDYGNIEEEVLSPTALQLHEAWCYYKKKCVSDDFSGVHPLPTPVNFNSNYWDNPYHIWAEYWSENPQVFHDLIGLAHGCQPVDNLDDLAECYATAQNWMIDFESEYGLHFTDEEEASLLSNAPCDNYDNFKDEVLITYLENTEAFNIDDQ
jgi:hypothetical protein